MSNNDGPAKILRRRLLMVIAPITLVVVVVTALFVIAGARLIIFPVYAESVTILLENLVTDLDSAEAEQLSYEKVLGAAASSGKFSFLIASPSGLFYHSDVIAEPEKVMAEALAGLAQDEQSRVRISGFGPGLRLLGISRLKSGRFLVVVERGSSFAGLYVKIFISGLMLVIFGVAASAWACSWLIFAPLWSRLQVLENALRKYGQGQRDLRLPLDEKAGAEGFLLVHFEFNRMADTISTLAAEREQRLAAERVWLAGLAHDLNTPMTIMRGHAENLVDHGHTLNLSEWRQRLSEILVQSLYMQALVDDLLTQASARMTTLKINPEWIELAELYDVLAETFYFPATLKEINLVADDQGVRVWADPLRLRQILVNLIRNALTHAHKANCIELLAEAGEGGSWVIVQDNGDGFEAGVEKTIFAAGKRGSDCGVKGWGLGLAVVEMLTEAHGGHCRVGPGLEGGARFEVWLPSVEL